MATQKTTRRRNGSRDKKAGTDDRNAASLHGAEGKPSAYGEAKPICMNAGCVLRKKAKCFGFEGCPGFKGA